MNSIIRFIVIFCTGVSSGLPLLITGSTLQAWMKDEGVDLTVIGIFSLVGLPFTLKFLWSPFMDRFNLPFLGRRRGWMLTTQVALMLAIAALGMSKPAESPWFVALLALLVNFFAASQDIVLDAYRREFLAENQLGMGTGLFVNGYRIGMLISGAFALALADTLSWQTVYFILAACMGIGIVTTFLAPEPKVDAPPPKTLAEAVVGPFKEYFTREGAIILLVFILLYKLGDNMASAMTMPMYLDIGFSKTEVGVIGKSFGLFATLGGALLGGAIMLKTGINRALWIFGFLQMLSTFGFSVLFLSGKNLSVLTAVIIIENVTAGMGTSAFTAFMAKLTNVRFTATQYALLSSLMGVPRVILSAPTGWMAKELGWFNFFLFCTLIALPGLFMLHMFAPWKKQNTPA